MNLLLSTSVKLLLITCGQATAIRENVVILANKTKQPR
ncbi:MAG: hypothetical protein FD170_1241 [Bacteroidetes bacterium]|nr:MAG: hypothetical protein FD170_1241 [Bacteroidota bacterium]